MDDITKILLFGDVNILFSWGGGGGGGGLFLKSALASSRLSVGGLRYLIVADKS